MLTDMFSSVTGVLVDVISGIMENVVDLELVTGTVVLATVIDDVVVICLLFEAAAVEVVCVCVMVDLIDFNDLLFVSGMFVSVVVAGVTIFDSLLEELEIGGFVKEVVADAVVKVVRVVVLVLTAAVGGVTLVVDMSAGMRIVIPVLAVF